MRKQSGFNLIELLIVVAIIGILGSIGYSSYQGYMVDARRGEATSRLQQLAQAQEKYYLDNNSYTKKLSDLGISESSTSDGNYTISMSTQSGGEAYTLTATADSSGKQKSDSDCSPITINSKNQRLPVDCW